MTGQQESFVSCARPGCDNESPEAGGYCSFGCCCEHDGMKREREQILAVIYDERRIRLHHHNLEAVRAIDMVLVNLGEEAPNYV